MNKIQTYRLDIAQSELDDLTARLRAARWPESETVQDWSQGVPSTYHREFCDYWANHYDWYATQNRLNRFDQFKTSLDGLRIHFIHVKSPHAQARPLLITHGWPGSLVEFHKIIGPLTDPEAYGGDPKDACHVICPSLPGYGFSDKPGQPGWDVPRIALAWDQLMQRLGYEAFFAQGGDWGAGVTLTMAAQNLGRCQSIHINMPTAGPSQATLDHPTAEDKRALKRIEYFQRWGAGYHKQQSTRPQTLGYSLADSPVAQAAWILEKFHAWTDCDGHPENVLSRDELIDNIMFYWLTNSGASSARLYWETFIPRAERIRLGPISMPVGVSVFPEEIMAGPRTWSEKLLPNIVYWQEVDKGGHFAAFEQPERFVQEVRNWLRIVA